MSMSARTQVAWETFAVKLSTRKCHCSRVVIDDLCAVSLSWVSGVMCCHVVSRSCLLDNSLQSWKHISREEGITAFQFWRKCDCISIHDAVTRVVLVLVALTYCVLHSVCVRGGTTLLVMVVVDLIQVSSAKTWSLIVKLLLSFFDSLSKGGRKGLPTDCRVTTDWLPTERDVFDLTSLT